MLYNFCYKIFTVRTFSRRKMFSMLSRAAVALLVVVGLSACVGDPTPQPTVTQYLTGSDQAVCDRLDFQGDPAQPESVTLTCKDGDAIVIPGPIKPGAQVGESIARPDGGKVPGDDGNLYINSASGKHYVWYYLMTENGEFRVWHDDQLIQRVANGETTISKIATRDFARDENVTGYLGW
jgi:hypothetical protein